ncbi:cytochrome P450 [Paractinoplanes ferrugineus]|uniref:Cytochrome P450 n=1 Tax=Paractinoplanes ferrugineus TaxID=113564 RepID=A0A919J558_9ACTN|nr:cytochrome P450 [Actinoplanes ferrugineus]GIE12759.1 cytochrome P450 [Actinoplanes ferrugineus]
MTPTTRPTTYPMSRAPGCPMDPPPRYAELRAKEPVSRATLWDGTSAWLISRQDDIRALLSDSRVVVDALSPGFPWLSELSKAVCSAADGQRSPGRMDPPEHTEMRRMLAPHFLVKRVRALRPATEELVDGLIDQLLAGPRPVDLVPALAKPVPSTVVGWVLGLPPDRRASFDAATARLFDGNGTPETALAARNDFVAQLVDLVEFRSREPDDGLVSRLIGFTAEGRLSRPSLLLQITLLVAAGYDTTVKMISTGVLALLCHPEQAALLTAGPERAEDATEELLRYLTVAEFAPKRVATADLEIGGQVIKAGEGIICLISSANRDEAVYEHPDVLNIDQAARKHLAFGFGVDLCVGHTLARMELEVVYGALFRRLPGLRLAVPFEDVPFSGSLDVQGVRSLPVTW